LARTTDLPQHARAGHPDMTHPSAVRVRPERFAAESGPTAQCQDFQALCPV